MNYNDIKKDVKILVEKYNFNNNIKLRFKYGRFYIYWKFFLLHYPDYVVTIHRMHGELTLTHYPSDSSHLL
jgi:hypothetical protein